VTIVQSNGLQQEIRSAGSLEIQEIIVAGQHRPRRRCRRGRRGIAFSGELTIGRGSRRSCESTNAGISIPAARDAINSLVATM